MPIVERIKIESKKKGITLSSLEKEIGLSSGAITKWNNSSPSSENLFKAALLLNVSMEYLLTGQEKINTLSDSEYEWLSLYHQLSEHDRIECAKFINGYIIGANNHNIK